MIHPAASAETTTEETTEMKSMAIVDAANYSNQNTDKHEIEQQMSDELSRKRNAGFISGLNIAVLSVSKFMFNVWLGSGARIDGSATWHLFYFRFFWFQYVFWKVLQNIFAIAPDISPFNGGNNAGTIIRNIFRTLIAVWVVFHVNYTVKITQRHFGSVCEQLAMHFGTRNLIITKCFLLVLMVTRLGSELYNVVVSVELIFSDPGNFTPWNNLIGQLVYGYGGFAYSYWLVSVAWLNHMTVRKLWKQLPHVQEAVNVRSIETVECEMNVLKWFEIYKTIWRQKNMSELKTIDDLYEEKAEKLNKPKQKQDKEKFIHGFDQNYPAFGGKLVDIAVIMVGIDFLLLAWWQSGRILKGIFEPLRVFTLIINSAVPLTYGVFLCETTRCYDNMLQYMERLGVDQPDLDAWKYCEVVRAFMQKEDLNGSIFGVRVEWTKLIKAVFVFVGSRVAVILLEILF